jgi:hypothetical protein
MATRYFLKLDQHPEGEIASFQPVGNGGIGNDNGTQALSELTIAYSDAALSGILKQYFAGRAPFSRAVIRQVDGPETKQSGPTGRPIQSWLFRTGRVAEVHETGNGAASATLRFAFASDEAHVSRTDHGQKHLNTLVISTIRIRLFDPFNEPMPGAPYRITLGDRAIRGLANDDAWLEVRAMSIPDQGTIEWGSIGPSAAVPARPPSSDDEVDPGWPKDGNGKPGSTNGYLYVQHIFLRVHPADESEAAAQRLHNLGFDRRDPLQENVRSFQQMSGREVTGKLSDIQADLLQWHDDCNPKPVPTLETPDAGW